ncbi:hypothetical protein ASPCADRAFT_203914 [Aspergillus carbonarius ITEM 5010]|uniref:Uncharacterized protein n=1 Tax=Aspergillus carbonarius (strain ITEM 5010) TaxID=602072 RepID=A0A1R3RZY2_ASPC5|nr:hypothetical protein ASPCADRAFT_203914 [Aspergillus carbonarius ITEM 5010]
MAFVVMHGMMGRFAHKPKRLAPGKEKQKGGQEKLQDQRQWIRPGKLSDDLSQTRKLTAGVSSKTVKPDGSSLASSVLGATKTWVSCRPTDWELGACLVPLTASTPHPSSKLSRNPSSSS